MTNRPLEKAPTDLIDILSIEHPLRLPAFNSDAAYRLGTHLRTRLRALYPHSPALISIALGPTGHQPLFLATTLPGTTADNHVWVARKTRTVARFGMSSWYMGRKFEGDEGRFAAKYGLDEVAAGGFAIHGGAVPVKVRGVEGAVGVLVVSGLKQDEDHMAAVEGLVWLRDELEAEARAK